VEGRTGMGMGLRREEGLYRGVNMRHCARERGGAMHWYSARQWRRGLQGFSWGHYYLASPAVAGIDAIHEQLLHMHTISVRFEQSFLC
jgi:hypothetical protein